MTATNYNQKATVATVCAICGTLGNATEIYPARLGEERLDEKAFSARRFYNEKIHFRMVNCNQCGLLRSDPIVDEKTYNELYERSALTYESHIDNLKKTYGYYLKKYENLVPEKGAFLEIGCGNGFFLEVAKEQGYKTVFGAEPSEEAIHKARADIQPFIKKGMFTKEMFLENSFDCITIFQTLDHFLDPSKVIRDALFLLKPGGILLAINHNLKAVSARILGEKSPIIDIEHTYLYDAKTIRIIFEKNGFEVVKIFYPLSRHSFGYFFSLLPIKPRVLKDFIHKVIIVLRMSNIPLFLPIGNLGIVARKKR